MKTYSVLLLFWFLKINFSMSKTCFRQKIDTKKANKIPKIKLGCSYFDLSFQNIYALCYKTQYV